MPSFAYSAINAQGAELTGEIQATDLSAARDALRGGGLLAQFIEELTTSSAKKTGFVKGKVKPKSLQVFSRQFATMIDAGLSVVTALVILEQQTDDKVLAAVLDDVREHVEAGELLSEALGRHPQVFSRLLLAMVEAGEAAGVLDVVLDRVALQIEKEEKIKRRVKGAMIYPIVVLVFATLVMTGMLLFLVPIFVKIFAQLGGQLPMLTQQVLRVSNLLRGYWFIIFPFIGIVIFAFLKWKKTEVGRQGWDRFKLRMPGTDRERRAQGRDGPLVAHAFDVDRLRRRHPARARDHGAGVRQLGRRGGDRQGPGSRPGGRDDCAAVDRQRSLPSDDRADGEDR